LDLYQRTEILEELFLFISESSIDYSVFVIATNLLDRITSTKGFDISNFREYREVAFVCLSIAFKVIGEGHEYYSFYASMSNQFVEMGMYNSARSVKRMYDNLEQEILVTLGFDLTEGRKVYDYMCCILKRLDLDENSMKFAMTIFCMSIIDPKTIETPYGHLVCASIIAAMSYYNYYVWVSLS
jgi:hypothetical protein